MKEWWNDLDFSEKVVAIGVVWLIVSITAAFFVSAIYEFKKLDVIEASCSTFITQEL